MVEINQAISDMLCKLVNKDHYREIKDHANRRLAPYRYGNGRVLFFDDCEGSTVKWKETAGGAGAVTVQTTRPFVGSKSYEMNLVALDANTIQIGRYNPRTNNAFLGVDFYFSISDGDYASPTELIIKLAEYGGGVYHRGMINLFFDGNALGVTIKYYGTSGAYITLPYRLQLNADNDDLQIFHHIKLVCDFKSNNFHYMILDNQFIDLRNLGLYKNPSPLLSLSVVQIEGKGKTGGADTKIYLDQISITDQEKLPKYPEQYEEYTEL